MNLDPERQESEGKLDQLKGKIKEAVGDATDNESQQAEGNWDRLKGEVKEGIGKLRGDVRDNV